LSAASSCIQLGYNKWKRDPHRNEMGRGEASRTKPVLQALRELADELAVLILAWAGFVSLILWLFRR